MMNPVAYPVPQQPPPKIQAAMEFLRFAHELETCNNYPSFPGEDWNKKGGRTLAASEKRVYDAAMMTLLEYFNADGFGEPGAPKSAPPDEGTAPQRQPA